MFCTVNALALHYPLQDCSLYVFLAAPQSSNSGAWLKNGFSTTSTSSIPRSSSLPSMQWCLMRCHHLRTTPLLHQPCMPCLLRNVPRNCEQRFTCSLPPYGGVAACTCVPAVLNFDLRPRVDTCGRLPSDCLSDYRGAGKVSRCTYVKRHLALTAIITRQLAFWTLNG